MRKKISLYKNFVCRKKKILGVENSVGASIFSSVLCCHFGVLSLSFSGGTVSFIQAVHLVLPVTDLKLLEI